MATKVIGTLGNVDNLTVGGRVMVDLTNLIVLVGRVAASNRTSFRTMNGSGGYTPSGSNRFQVVAAYVVPNNATQVQTPAVLYSDNDVGVNSATAFTNPVYVGGDQGSAILALAANSSGQQFPMNWIIPNGKYVGVQSAGSGEDDIIYFYGYEIT